MNFSNTNKQEDFLNVFVVRFNDIPSESDESKVFFYFIILLNSLLLLLLPFLLLLLFLLLNILLLGISRRCSQIYFDKVVETIRSCLRKTVPKIFQVHNIIFSLC